MKRPEMKWEYMHGNRNCDQKKPQRLILESPKCLQGLLGNEKKEIMKKRCQSSKFRRVLIVVVLMLLPVQAWAVYDVPSGRKINWEAGLDSVGGIPTYTSVTCTSAKGDGISEDGANIQGCINAAPAKTAVFLPAGTYKVSSEISMKSNVVLRGAGASYPWLPAASAGSTVIELYNEKKIRFDGGSKEGMGSNINIESGHVKGSNKLTLGSVSGLQVNNYISIFQDNDPRIVDASKCSWCGDDSGTGKHCMQQFARITAIDGKVITIDPSMYYTYSSADNPQIKKVTASGDFGLVKAGLEDLKINNKNTAVGGPMIYGRFARHCWIKSVETYNAGIAAKDDHLRLEFCYGFEIRDSHFHHGRAYSSDRNYGVYLLFWNSAHKIENNILYGLRHAINFEGGGSGCAILYNYMDAGFEAEEQSFLSADLNSNHGPHPHMNLIEGNVSAKITHDWTMGSSSHNTLFRNWARGWRSTPPIEWGVWAIDIQNFNRYFNIVGNVIGMTSWTTGTVLADNNCTPEEPAVYRFGCTGQPGYYQDPKSYETAIIHGNYDYITDGVADWDGGADHVLRDSMYYSSKPSFFGKRNWPPFGFDQSPVVGRLPAQDRFEGDDSAPPSPPGNLRIVP